MQIIDFSKSLVGKHSVQLYCVSLLFVMKLVPISLSDLPLYEKSFGDPVYMAELGGIQPPDKIPGILARQVACNEKDSGWVLKMVPTEEDVEEGELDRDPELSLGVGTVCVWGGEFQGEPCTEMGWGVITKYQNRGFATKGVRLMLEKAKENGRWGMIHVFTSTTNVASNAMCRTLGFELLGETDIDYDGRPLHSNHYQYDARKVE